jgi:dihydrofolate synthase/folylpolyglutamate synthase
MPPVATPAGLAAWLAAGVDHERSGSFAAIGLERIAAFVRFLPKPATILTVAGTKGKGSTVRFTEAILRAHGCATLAFTSPHVLHLNERWRWDGIPAGWEVLAEAAAQVEHLIVRHQAELTWFERSFAIALVLASARPGTVFLCEVGLGGRLDCANVLDASVVALAHLSHDHRDVLGPTLWHIAREKLAVARSGRPLLIAPQSAAGAEAIRAHLPAGVDATWIAPAAQLELALPGAHQQGNAAVALAAARCLLPALDEAVARQALATARLAARCQLVANHGRNLLVDGAHNGPSIAATLAVANVRLRPGWTMILGLASDKEVDEILAAIPAAQTVLRCGYDSPRARGPQAWPARAQAWPWHPDIASALVACAPAADVCVTGSLYLAGEALAHLGVDELPG